MSSRRPMKKRYPSAVEEAEVAGRVEAVGGEHLVAGPAADPAHEVRTPELDLAGLARGQLSVPASTSTMRTSTSANGRPQLPRLADGRSRSSGSAQYGPNDSVIPSRFGRPPAPRRAPGREHRGEAVRLQVRQVGGREVGVRGDGDGLVGPTAEQRHPLAFEQAEGRGGFRLALGDQRRPGDERREQAGAQAAHPEERHGDVEAIAGFEAPDAEARPGRAERTPVGVDHALRRAPTSRGEHDHQVVGGSHRARPRRVDDLVGVTAPAGRRRRARSGVDRGCAASAAGPSRPEVGERSRVRGTPVRT